MKAGITGLPYSGKTSLFCALTGQDFDTATSRREIHIGTVKVPDFRLEKLYDMFRPKKITHATMEYFDIAGQSGGSDREMEPKALQTLKNADSLIVVLDAFSDNADPERDFSSFMEELAFNDLVVATNRIERLGKEMRCGTTDALSKEKALLEKCSGCLENGDMLRDMALAFDEEKTIRGFQFLTRKPLIIVVNISEQLLAAGKADDLEKRFGTVSNTACAAVCVEIEREVSAIDDADERAEFLDSMGITEPALNRIIRLSYKSLGLISFFTAGGDDEVRAWTVRKNSPALECAGAIHSDLERGFIRSETIAFDDLYAAGSFKAARDQGLLRIEGRDYIVQDGEVLTIRFSV